LASFPPYELLDSVLVAETQAKFRRLENIYHASHTKSWDGRAVLQQLLEEHGRSQIEPEKKRAIGQIFSVILWGELAAWNVATDLALSIDDVEAKMAASSQAYDEARHFYVMRDYLLSLQEEIPPLDPYSRLALIEVAKTKSLPKKMVGMQLLVENVALHLFKMVAKANVDPVLTQLMPYFERDEARHVGLGMHYLPQVLKDISVRELVELQLFQIKILVLVFWSAYGQRHAFRTLGLDPHLTFMSGLKKQAEVISMVEQSMGRSFTMTREGQGDKADPLAQFWRSLNLASVHTFFPRDGVVANNIHATGLEAADTVVRTVGRILEVVGR
jgi:hypothetical protein